MITINPVDFKSFPFDGSLGKAEGYPLFQPVFYQGISSVTVPRAASIEETSFRRAQGALFQGDCQAVLLVVNPALFGRDTLEVLEYSSLRKAGSKELGARKKVLLDLRHNRAFLSKSLGEALRRQGISKFSVDSKEVVFEEVSDQDWTAFLAQLAALLELLPKDLSEEDSSSERGLQFTLSEKRSKGVLNNPRQARGFLARGEAFSSSSEKLQETEKQALEFVRKREKEHLSLMKKRARELLILKEELQKQLFFLGFSGFAAV